MELWVRSQDRDYLEKVEKIYVWGNSPDGYVIESKGELGTYKSKERALEVLDEIQKILKPQLIIKDSGKVIGSFEDTIIREGATCEIKELTTYVYEMPKE